MSADKEDTTDRMLDASVTALVGLAPVSSGNMELWSEEKRSDFVKLFENRSRAAQYILYKTGRLIIEAARHRHFIGHRLSVELQERGNLVPPFYDKVDSRIDYQHVGGRTTQELDLIAKSRAELILNELPPVRQAVEVIDPETSKKMRQRDKLQDKLRALKGALEQIPNHIKMAEVDQNMTVGAFRAMIKDLEKRKKNLVEEMCEVGAEGQELDSFINKKLYNGLPGLAEAVKVVVIQHFERVTALSSTTRRVEEKVKFGDSEAAVDLLKGFEKDEVKVSSTVRDEFRAAMEKLNLMGKRKQLSGGKKGRSKS